MKINYDWATHQILVRMDEVEAQRIAAFIFDALHISADPEADPSTRLEDAFTEVLST